MVLKDIIPSALDSSNSTKFRFQSPSDKAVNSCPTLFCRYSIACISLIRVLHSLQHAPCQRCVCIWLRGYSILAIYCFQISIEDTMNQNIRIPPDRREVAVIKSQSVVTDIVCRINRFCHGANGEKSVSRFPLLFLFCQG